MPIEPSNFIGQLMGYYSDEVITNPEIAIDYIFSNFDDDRIADLIPNDVLIDAYLGDIEEDVCYDCDENLVEQLMDHGIISEEEYDEWMLENTILYKHIDDESKSKSNEPEQLNLFEDI